MAAHPAPQRLWAVLAVVLLAGMVVGGVAPAASAGSPPSCRVDNETQGTEFASDSGQALLDAIAAAVPGDQLAVLGTCRGNFRLDKSLTLTGISQKRYPAPTLDGQQAGTTLTVGLGAAVTLTNLTITGGTAFNGGGIYNFVGTLTLDTSTVRGNTADAGGGIFNNGGTVRLHSSTLSGNTARSSGGGIYNFDGTASLENTSTVSGNTAGRVGGGIDNHGGTLTLDTSTVSGNTAGSSGGGIHNGGTLTLDTSTVSGNKAETGGGIFNAGTLTLHSSTVSGNTADVSGGGIYNFGGTVTLDASIVNDNIPDNCVDVPGC